MQDDHEDGLVTAIDDLHHHDDEVMRDTGFSRTIDRLVDLIGEAFSWLWLVLLAVIIGNVILRYVFSQGMIELEELQWYLYAAAWLVGLSYTFISDGHVRVDVVHDRLSLRTRMWLEFLGLTLLFLPFVLFVIYYSIPFVELSWQTNETSTSANGLPARWLIKGCLLFSFLLLLLVGAARLIRVIATLRHGPVSANGAT
ncbi:TRAP transporter small permease subunit [Roseovarius aestuarii]|uniref:TRAP transporter small permease protein n=1 Tax=Roseovarius aestuarii TaxID=475083 RepID=A0A1X7BX00_9RHOB|nr:TRAP transporter small permease subunit [Roseovarius aestuarii]SMC14138.1 2,3-diketo-L-gulonate TRAP transporter small permease protein YiaM [Roseovarius aestuarii]